MNSINKQTIRVLMAEDNEVDFLAFSRYQDNQLLNFETTCVPTVSETREHLERYDYDVVVIDYLLEDGNGLEIIPHLNSIPFVFVTGDRNIDLAVQAMKKGAYDYIVKDYNGKYLKLLSKIIEAAAKQKSAQLALAQSEKKLNLLHQAMTCVDSAIIIANKNGNIRWVNDYFTKLTGYSNLELMESNGEVLHPYNTLGFHPISPYYQNVYRTKRSTQFESKMFSKSGDVIYTLTTLSPVLDDDNNITSIISVDIDISKRKDFEKELLNAKMDAETAVRAKDLFLANISHEIRTPLNDIMGSTHLLADRLEDDKSQTFLKIIKESSENLLAIINDILDYNKLTQGNFTIVQHVFSLPLLLQSISDSSNLRSTEAKVDFVTNIPKTYPKHLIGDPVRIKQILNNLLSNAFKFTDKGSVTLSLDFKELNNDYLEFEFKIKDSGIGIPSDKLQKVFEKFTQIQDAYNRNFDGTGLGLSISKKLTEMMGGNISIESQLKKGTEVSLVIPLKISSIAPDFENSHKILPTKILEGIAGIEVLLVEDNVMNQIIGQKFLQKLGTHAEVASSGSEAIQKLHNKTYDLILMDLQMPEMDGFTATQMIREKFPLPTCNIPIIAMTAHAVKGVEQQCLDKGMNDYISKPINYQSLMEKLYQVYHNRNTHTKN
ncbi:MAG: PAS domain S-box-containing protein [Flavobacteriales bacterium]|jgi:PAS domain S-box-containing protein